MVGLSISMHFPYGTILILHFIIYLPAKISIEMIPNIFWHLAPAALTAYLKFLIL